MDPVTEEWARWWVGTQKDFTPLLAPLGLTVYDSHCLGIPGGLLELRLYPCLPLMHQSKPLVASR